MGLMKDLLLGSLCVEKKVFLLAYLLAWMSVNSVGLNVGKFDGLFVGIVVRINDGKKKRDGLFVGVEVSNVGEFVISYVSQRVFGEEESQAENVFESIVQFDGLQCICEAP